MNALSNHLIFVYGVAKWASKTGKEFNKQWGSQEKVSTWKNGNKALDRDVLLAINDKRLLLAIVNYYQHQ